MRRRHPVISRWLLTGSAANTSLFTVCRALVLHCVECWYRLSSHCNRLLTPFRILQCSFTEKQHGKLIVDLKDGRKEVRETRVDESGVSKKATAI